MPDPQVATPDQTGLQNPFDTPTGPAATPAQTGLANPFDQPAPVGSTPKPPSPPEPTLGDKMKSFVDNLTSPVENMAGAAKGVGDAVHGVGELIRKGGNAVSSGLGDKIVPPVGQTALDKATTAQGPGQYAGKALENVLEFILGEGAVGEVGKTLSVGDKLKQVGTISKFLEANPTIAKMLATGANTGVVTAAQTTAKTGSPTEGAEAGAAGAVTGAALTGLGAIRNLYKGATDTATIQPIIQKGIRDTLSDVADKAGVKVPTSDSIRDVVSDTAEAVKSKSQPVFQKLDQLSGGQLSDAQAEAAKYRGSLDKAGKDAYQAALDKQDALFQKYQDQFPKGSFDQAKAQWKQYRALQEVDNALKLTTTGSRPAIAATSAAKQPAETVNPKQFLARVNRLYNDGTLQTALGEDKAHQLLDHAGAAAGKLESIQSTNKTLSTVAKAAPYVGVTGLAGYAAKKALSGTQGH